MKTSARNQFWGEVVALKRGPVSAEVVLRIDGGEQVVAVITDASVAHLGLKEGGRACALIKAPSVLLTLDDTLRISARNRLAGKVIRCQEGPIMGEVTLQLNSGPQLTAVVTAGSIRALGLKEEMEAWALIKATNVILAVED